MGIFSKKQVLSADLRQEVLPAHYERMHMPVMNINGSGPMTHGLGQLTASLGPNESLYGTFEPTGNGGISFAIHRRSTKGDVEAFADMVAEALLKRGNR